METLAVAFLPHEKEHSAPIGHPENADRLSLVSDLLGQLRGKGMLEDLAITEHGSKPVEAVHNRRLTMEIESLARRGGGYPAERVECPALLRQEPEQVVVDLGLGLTDRKQRQDRRDLGRKLGGYGGYVFPRAVVEILLNLHGGRREASRAP